METTFSQTSDKERFWDPVRYQNLRNQDLVSSEEVELKHGRVDVTAWM